MAGKVGNRATKLQPRAVVDKALKFQGFQMWRSRERLGWTWLFRADSPRALGGAESCSALGPSYAVARIQRQAAATWIVRDPAVVAAAPPVVAAAWDTAAAASALSSAPSPGLRSQRHVADRGQDHSQDDGGGDPDEPLLACHPGFHGFALTPSPASSARGRA
jgi:hypothetical protein